MIPRSKRQKTLDQAGPKEGPKPADHPYLEHERHWMERYGSFIAREHSWKMMAFLSMGVAGIAIAGCVYLSSQFQLVPVIVHTDSQNDVQGVEAVDPKKKADTGVVRARLRRQIIDLRAVFAEVKAQTEFVNEGWAGIAKGSQAEQKARAYFSADEHNPYKRAAHETVEVIFKSALPITDTVWRIEWDEKTVPRNGVDGPTTHWEGNFTVSRSSPKDMATFMLNPFGIWINDFEWTERPA